MKPLMSALPIAMFSLLATAANAESEARCTFLEAQFHGEIVRTEPARQAENATCKIFVAANTDEGSFVPDAKCPLTSDELSSYYLYESSSCDDFSVGTKLDGKLKKRPNENILFFSSAQ